MNLIRPTNLSIEFSHIKNRTAVAAPAGSTPLYSFCSLKGRAICFVKCLSHIAQASLRTVIYLVTSAISAVFFALTLTFCFCKTNFVKLTAKDLVDQLACTVVTPLVQLALAARAAAGIICPAAYFKKSLVTIDSAFETTFIKEAKTHIKDKAKDIQYMLDVLTGRKHDHRPGGQLQAFDEEQLFPQMYQMLKEINSEFSKPGKVSDNRKKSILNDIADVVKECHPAWYSRILELHLTIKEPDNLDERVAHYAHIVLNAAFNEMQILLDKFKDPMLGKKMPDFHVVNVVKTRFAKELNVDLSKIKYDYFSESWESWMKLQGFNDQTHAAMLLSVYRPGGLVKEVSTYVNADHNQDLRSHLLTKLHEEDGGGLDQSATLKKYTKNNHYQGPLNETAIRRCLKKELEACNNFIKKYQSIWDQFCKQGLEATVNTNRTKL